MFGQRCLEKSLRCYKEYLELSDEQPCTAVLTQLEYTAKTGPYPRYRTHGPP